MRSISVLLCALAGLVVFSPAYGQCRGGSSTSLELLLVVLILGLQLDECVIGFVVRRIGPRVHQGAALSDRGVFRFLPKFQLNNRQPVINFNDCELNHARAFFHQTELEHHAERAYDVLRSNRRGKRMLSFVAWQKGRSLVDKAVK